PVLGYIALVVALIARLLPGSALGYELAAVFALFTSQAWNLTFSLYQSLKTVPKDLREAARAFGLSRRQTFWRLEVPFATPGLVWNAMMSMSGGWFFIVASEAITVSGEDVALPGIGSYIAAAPARARGLLDRVLPATAVIAAALGLAAVLRLLFAELGFAELARALLLGLATAARVLLLTALAALVWVPIGIVVGMRPALARLV